MRKYPPNESCCGAVYDNAPADNPFLAALPEMLPRDEFLSTIRSTPGLPHDLPRMSPEERRQSLPMLASLFVPLDYMYAVYDQLYRAIRETYTTRTAMEEIRQINALFCGKENISYATQAASGSVLGVPGIGKTSTIRRALETMPQVIEHTEYMGQPFYCKQVLYLRIECPSDCSVKTLALNLLSALDRAIGSDYLHQLISLRSIAASAVATQVKILCMTHHVGLLLVDEIQNAVETARRNRQIKPLLKFLVELTNDTATAVYFVGTPVAEQLFVQLEEGGADPAGMVDLFEEEEQQREVAQLFHTGIGRLENKSEAERALHDIVCNVKRNSYEYYSQRLGTDISALNQVIEGKKALEELNKMHISLD